MKNKDWNDKIEDFVLSLNDWQLGSLLEISEKTMFPQLEKEVGEMSGNQMRELLSENLKERFIKGV